MLCDECVLVEGGFAINSGNHHGDAVFDRNLYGDPCRLRYCTRVLLHCKYLHHLLHDLELKELQTVLEWFLFCGKVDPMVAW